LLTILSDISRIVRVRGHKGAARVEVGRAAGTPRAEKPLGLVREISGPSTAAGLIERLNGQLVRRQFQLSLRPGRPQASLGEHLAIIAAISPDDGPTRPSTPRAAIFAAL
jgi:hypothetical protein